MKIIFMGTPDFAVPSMEKVFNSSHELKLVISQLDKPRGRGKKILPTAVKKRALELGVEVFQTENINSGEAFDLVKKYDPDIIVVVAYGQILKPEFLKIPKIACINVHASLLPKLRGAAPINWAILNGDKETGITIMKMNEGLDTGDMLISKKLEIAESMDSINLYEKLSELGGEILLEVLNNYDEYYKNRVVQDDSISTYAPILTKNLGEIDWTKSAKEIHCQIRGLKPWPTAYTKYANEVLKIHNAGYMLEENNYKNGEIVDFSNEGIKIACKDGFIIAKSIQFPNKKMMLVSDYLKGNELRKGIILE